MQSHYMLFKFRKVNKVNLKLTKQKKTKKKKKKKNSDTWLFICKKQFLEK